MVLDAIKAFNLFQRSRNWEGKKKGKKKKEKNQTVNFFCKYQTDDCSEKNIR